MDQLAYRRAKHFILSVFSIFCILITAFTCWLLWRQSWPIDPYLETEHLKKAVSYSNLALVGDFCYEFSAGENFTQLCAFDSWKQTKSDNFHSNKHILTLKLGDEYEMAFREGGIVEVFNGYSAKHHVSTAWYVIPEDISASVAEYIQRVGTVRQPLLGPGSWFIINK